MPKNNKPSIMPGADPMDDADEPMLDLSFMEQTDEEKAAEIAAQEAKDALKAEADAEIAAEEAKKAEIEAAAKADEEAEKKPAKKEEVKEELAEDEKKLAAEIEADKTKGKKQPMVPKSRLDEVLAKNREMAEQLKQAAAAREAAQPKPAKDAVAFDFDAKEGEYMQHVLDGEKDKALAVRKEIRAAEQAEITKTTRQTSGQDSEALALAKAAAEVEANFPQFVEGSKEYNAEATSKVIKMRDALIMQGTNAVEALSEAVDFVVRKYDFDVALEGSKDEKIVNLDDKRKKDVQKKVDLQKKQPPDLDGEGERSRNKKEANAVVDMTDAEWDALPDATRRRLRGDII